MSNRQKLAYSSALIATVPEDLLIEEIAAVAVEQWFVKVGADE